MDAIELECKFTELKDYTECKRYHKKKLLKIEKKYSEHHKKIIDQFVWECQEPFCSYRKNIDEKNRQQK